MIKSNKIFYTLRIYMYVYVNLFIINETRVESLTSIYRANHVCILISVIFQLCQQYNAE